MSCTVSAVCHSKDLRDLFRFVAENGKRRNMRIRCETKFSNEVLPVTFSSSAANHSRTSEGKVSDTLLKQAALVQEQRRGNKIDAERYGPIGGTRKRDLLDYAYDGCGEVCSEFAKTYYLGTLLMTPERQRAMWALYVWCRRTDELVDGPNASHTTQKALDRWEQRLTDIYEGHPYDMYDAALCDTLSKFHLHIQPFMDLIQGMRMDLEKSRYKNFDELYLYCYCVAGTVGLMSVPVMGISPESKASTVSVCNAALALGIANQLTNILRDVGEDAKKGRIYLPQDELRRAGISEEDIFRGKVTEKWRNFMREQIKRARMFFEEAENGIGELNSDSRWPIWSSLLIYRQILDAIEANDYNVFKKRVVVGNLQKLLALPVAYGKAISCFSLREL